MKKQSLTSKILAVIAFLLILVVICLAVHITITVMNAGKSAGGENLEDYDVVFTCDTTILDENYEIMLKGKDGKFSLDVGNLKGVMDGTYSFTEGQGWAFAFDDNLKFNVRSQYNKETKTHEFLYPLDLGSRGQSNIRLVRQDEKFSAAEKAWDDIPMFSGIASWFNGVVTDKVTCICDAEGNFRIFGTEFDLSQISGTYAIADGAYSFTCNDGRVVTSEIDEKTGLPGFMITVHFPTLEAYNQADTDTYLTLVELTEGEPVAVEELPEEEETELPANMILSDDGLTQITFNEDGTYLFEFPTYSVQDSGTYTLVDGILTVVNANGLEMTMEDGKLHYVSSMSDQLVGDFTISDSFFENAFSEETNNGLIQSDDGATQISFNPDGTYLFEFPAYSVQDAGTYVWADGVLTVVNANGLEMTMEDGKLHYISSMSDQLVGDFTIDTAIFG